MRRLWEATDVWESIEDEAMENDWEIDIACESIRWDCKKVKWQDLVHD